MAKAKPHQELTIPDEASRQLRESEEQSRQLLAEEREVERQQDVPDQQVASVLPEPPSPPTAALGGWFLDNPKNPRGVPSSLTDGTPNAQATNAQKIQDPTPSRPPLAATATTSVLERVSAGQNRKPPAEVIP